VVFERHCLLLKGNIEEQNSVNKQKYTQSVTRRKNGAVHIISVTYSQVPTKSRVQSFHVVEVVCKVIVAPCTYQE